MNKNIYKKFLSLVYILTPLLCIYAGETTKLAFLFELKKTGSEATTSLLNSFLMSLSLASVPWIGLFSDKNCRKKTLICLVLFELAALLLLGKTPFIAVTIQGLIGAAVVAVGRAAYLDIRPYLSNKNNFISAQNNNLLAGMAVVETLIVQATAWVGDSLLLGLDLVFLSKILFIFSIFLLIIFKDMRDKEKTNSSHEVASAQREYLSGYAWKLLVAFFLYDCAFQTPNYFSESHDNVYKLSREINVIGGGILAGCLLAWMVLLFLYHASSLHRLVIQQEKMLFRIKQCLFVCSFALFVVFLFPFLKHKSILHSNVELIHLGIFASIGGIVLALFFIYFTNKVKPHERGFLYGILEEVETLAEAISPVFVYNFLPKEGLTNIPFLILIGSGLVCIRRYKERKKSSST